MYTKNYQNHDKIRNSVTMNNNNTTSANPSKVSIKFRGN